MARHETVTASVHVERPPAEVFDYLADVALHGEWSPKPYRVEGVAAGQQVAADKRFTSFGWLPGDKDHRNDVEVTAVQAPSRRALSSTDKGHLTRNTFMGGRRRQRLARRAGDAGAATRRRRGRGVPADRSAADPARHRQGARRLRSNLEGRA